MTNSRLKCTGCKERFPSKEMLSLPAGKFHSVGCATTYGKNKGRAALARRREKERKQINKAKRDFDRQDISWQHRQTQKAFNRMRVLEEKLWFYERGLVPECISCRKNGDFCCGHFKTRGAQSGLRYDKRNTFLQCNTYCNKNLSGNIEGNKNTRGYKQGLIDRFGPDEAARIIEYCETNTQIKKWDWRELEEFRKQCNKRIRELEKEVGKYEI